MRLTFSREEDQVGIGKEEDHEKDTFSLGVVTWSRQAIEMWRRGRRKALQKVDYELTSAIGGR
jgi:hypothetical protein